MASAVKPLGLQAVEARYNDVERHYAETRDIRLLGFVFFLISDCVLFASFIFAYMYLRVSAPAWPPFVDGHQLPWFDTAFAALNSVVLFGSGVTMHFALENWKHLNKQKFNAWLLATIVLGIAFLLGQAHEWSLIKTTWQGSSMGASFFTLTGMHGFHVFVGVIYLTVLGFQANRGVYTGSKYFGLTAGTLYWHFVDVIWVALFFLFYLW
ncbi:MAG: cytochrome c oxidase subunit 3 [Candidatus Baltobacteraceae bacterium]|jgi:cytochrome c oxidase subunit 3